MCETQEIQTGQSSENISYFWKTSLVYSKTCHTKLQASISLGGQMFSYKRPIAMSFICSRWSVLIYSHPRYTLRCSNIAIALKDPTPSFEY